VCGFAGHEQLRPEGRGGKPDLELGVQKPDKKPLGLALIFLPCAVKEEQEPEERGATDDPEDSAQDHLSEKG
jgi:hypothetical protein